MFFGPLSVLFSCRSPRDTLRTPRPVREVVYPVVIKLLLRGLPKVWENARLNALLGLKDVIKLVRASLVRRLCWPYCFILLTVILPRGFLP